MATNMTSVRGSIKLTRLKQGTTLTSELYADKPLVQYLSENNTKATPDWKENTSTRPRIYPLVSSSISLGEYIRGQGILIDFEWWLDGVKITEFGVDADFDKGTVSSSDPTETLIIQSNIMQNATVDRVIMCKFKVVHGGYTTPVTLTIPIKRGYASPSAYEGHISFGSDNHSITNSKRNVVLKAILYQGGELVNGAIVDWYRIDAEDITDNTDDVLDGLVKVVTNSDTITITDAMVDLADTFVAKFFVSNNEVAVKSMQVYDLSDPLVIKIALSPQTNVVYEGVDVTITPSVAWRDDRTTPVPAIFQNTQFTFLKMAGLKPVGEVVTAQFIKVGFTDFEDDDSLNVFIETTT